MIAKNNSLDNSYTVSTLQRNLSIGSSNDPLEHEADEVASKVLGNSPKSTISNATPRIQRLSSSSNHTQISTPDSVDKVVSNGGQPMQSGLRNDMEKRFGEDFSQVRLHTNYMADQSAHDVKAHAYTLGNNVVFGSGKFAPNTTSGRKLLAHELTHVVQQKTIEPREAVVQRVGFFESLSRFFGGGNFSDDELVIYLSEIEQTGQIEDNNDSDNKARRVVEQNLHQPKSVDTRIILIREMLSGFTGNSDEEAILKIIGDASALEKEVIIEKIDIGVFEDNFQGEQFVSLQRILADSIRSPREPVGTDWYMTYRSQGATNLRPNSIGLGVEQLDAAPTSSDEVIQVVQNVSNTHSTGARQRIASGIQHPRDSGGRASMNFYVAPLANDGTLMQGTSSNRLQNAGIYAPIQYNAKEVTANVAVKYTSQQSGNATTTRGNTRTTGSDTRTGISNTNTNSNTTGGREVDSRTNTRSRQRSRSNETAVSNGQQQGQSNTTSTTISLSGTLSAELRADTRIQAGAEIGAELLAALLMLAGPEGIALYATLQASGALDSTKLTLGLSGGLGFTLGGSLTGSVARTWSETRSTLISSGVINTARNGSSAGRSRSNTRSNETNHSNTNSNSNETNASNGTSESNSNQSSRSETDLNYVPIIEETSIEFEVK